MAYIVLGMSGGVDSSVAAYLLKQQGHRVLGVFMKNWEEDDDSEYCSSRQDWRDCVSVAEKLGIEIDYINFAQEYQDRVFKYFLEEYQSGRTPNPDILCNSEIKFNAFLNHALNLGADYIATGHYTDLAHTENGVYLKKSLDLGKDQSYFLYRLNQAQLSKSIFPLGRLLKSQVRKIAEDAGLHNARKKDSTGICFIGERPFREFLNRYLPTRPGLILDEQGQAIGEHQGLAFYTIGQRKGLQVGGIKNAAQLPWFVAKKDMANNTLTLVQGKNHKLLWCEHVDFKQISWCNPDFLEGHDFSQNAYEFNLSAKTRYRQADTPCSMMALTQSSSKALGDIASCHFPDGQWAVTPGQSIVLYQKDICLGGGIII